LRSRDIPFDEWYRHQQNLNKAPSANGNRSPISPGAGMLGPQAPRYGTTATYPPPNAGTFGPQLIGPSDSKYTDQRPQGSPQQWVDDVDMQSNFFSPFQPIWPFGPPNIETPREWDYPVGYNLQFIQPRINLMAMLRGMARTWGVLAAIIATRQDQLLRIPWTIQKKGKPSLRSPFVDEMQQFFKRPDGKLYYSQWARKLLYDLLELDAPCIYFARDRKGRPLAAEVISGQTIFPIIDDAGRRPDSIVEIDEDGLTYIRRQPAFQQIIKGLPLIDFDESELMYVPMRVRPDMPMFGYPPTEQILVETSEAIRKTFYQLNFWAEGTIPDLIVTVPKEWTPRQIAMFQAHFDAMLSGNLRQKTKVRFLPGDMKPFDVKNSSGESLWSQRDETLIRLACYAYSVSPAPFIKMMNRSTAQNAQQMAEEEGLYPLMSYWKDNILDPIIQERFGYDDVEAIFLPKPEPDQEKAATIHQIKIKTGEMSINEAREEAGFEPIPNGDQHLIYVGNAVIPLSAAVSGAALPSPGGGAGGPSHPPVSDHGSPAPSSERQSRVPMRGPASSSPTAEPTPSPTATAKLLTRGEIRDAARGATEDLDTLSQNQINAGNYPKGHLSLYGLDISIENDRGSKRGEKTQAGKKEFVTMPAPYGYIRGTIGADKSQLDVYIGKSPKSNRVWIVDQNKVKPSGKVKGFDEHKIFLAYKSAKKVLKDYLSSHFDGHGRERMTALTELSIPEFKSWLKSGDTTEPVADQGFGRVVARSGDLTKLDTISTSTNLLSRGGPRPKSTKKKKAKKRSGSRWLELRA